jgi:hypothetical protein
MMIGNKVLSGGTIQVDVVGGQFSFDVKKSARASRISTISSRKEAAIK